ncbi:hypothetical protein H1R20_g6060, partial [Candolleomyces eurysporus]
MPATPTPRRRPHTTTPKNSRYNAASNNNSYFLSQHSSNPLELHRSSSEGDDTSYYVPTKVDQSRTRTTGKAKRRLSNNSIQNFTSDDPLAAYPDMQEYQQHIAEVIPAIAQARAPPARRGRPPIAPGRSAPRKGGSRTSTPRKAGRTAATRYRDEDRGEGPSGVGKRSGAPTNARKQPARPDVDEDEVMDSQSEDELEVYGQDDTPRKRVVGVSTPTITLTAAVGDYDEDPVDQEEVGMARYVDEDEEMGYPGEVAGEDGDGDVVPNRARSRRRRVVMDEDDDMDGKWLDRDEEQDALAQEPEPGGYQVSLNDVDSPDAYGEEEAEEEEEEEEKTPFDLDSAEELSTLQRKPSDEQEEILSEILDFTQAVPSLSGNYKLLDRLGTGTFSSVYKAIDLNYHTYDNSPWLGHHPPGSSAHYQSQERTEGRKAFVAIKRIYVTSGPERIKNELVIMESARGCRHVSQLVTAFRCEDQVAVVMPYHRNDDFRDYFQDLPMPGIKEYFRCLMRALRDIHTRGIIHRDVKPANFLFDPRTGQGSLCDFGLAQRFDSRVPSSGACLHTTGGTLAHPHGEYLLKNEYSVEMVQMKQAEARKKCKELPERVGYPDKDPRVPMKANRAGTRGFRAPEVLLKSVDVWSAGIILLFFLTHKFPVFQANDDIEALMEIAAILGKSKMEKVATLHCRTFATNIPDIVPEQMTWREFTERLNPELRVPPEPNSAYYPYTLPSYKARMRDEELGVGLDLDLDDVGEGEGEGAKDQVGEGEKVKDEAAEMVVDDEDHPKSNASADAIPPTNPIPIPTTTTNRVMPPTSSSPLTPLSGEESDKGLERCLGVASEIVGASTSAAASSKPISKSKSTASSVETGVKADIKGKGKAKDEDEESTTAIKREEEEKANAEAKQKQKEAAKRKAIEAAKAKRQAEELEAYKQDVENALGLLEGLLHPESVRRLTPKEALAHPFLAEVDSGASHPSSSRLPPQTRISTESSTHTKPSVDLKGKSRAIDSFPSHSSGAPATSAKDEVKMKNDDDYEPRPFATGVCGDMHFVDPVTDQPGVIAKGRKK